EKFREERTVSLNNKQRELIRQVRKEFAVGDMETKWVPVTHTWIQRIAGGFHPVSLEMISDAKLRLTEDLVMEEFRGQPVVIWFRFSREIEAVHEWLTRRNKKLRVEDVHGKVDRAQRPKVQERVQSGKTQVILLQVQ